MPAGTETTKVVSMLCKSSLNISCCLQRLHSFRNGGNKV